MSADRTRITTAVLTCGGTGGHVFPAVAVAHELRSRVPDVRLCFIARAEGFESPVLSREGFDVETVRIGRLARQSLARRALSALQLPVAVLSAMRILRRHRPQVVIGTGGFVSGPAMLAAVLLRLPTLIQEQNAVPGLTNGILRRIVRRVALAHAPEEELGREQVVTGNPVRPEFFGVSPWRVQEPCTVLVMGGSQGARSLNEAVIGAAHLLDDLAGRVRIVLQCGPRWEAETQARLENCAIDIQASGFLNDVPAQLDAASLVVCRAGASTLAEISAAGRPSVLVPLPSAANDHQTHNARAVVDEGAGQLLPDAELTPERFANVVRESLEQPERLESEAKAARKMAREDAAARIVDLAEDIAAAGPSESAPMGVPA